MHHSLQFFVRGFLFSFDVCIGQTLQQKFQPLLLKRLIGNLEFNDVTLMII